MTGEASEVVNKTLEVFLAKKALTADEIATLLGASLPTVRRRLKKWKSYRSYNKNGRYYVLPEVPRFDDNGLWLYRGIGFSIYGNLGDTLVHLITQSSAGLCAAEVGVLLGVQSYGFLWLCRDHPRLRREKHQGRFVYFSSEEAVYCRQKELREQGYELAQLPSDAEAIAVLVAAIKHPEFDAAGLCGQLEAEGVASTPQRIENLFARHGLTPKKTPVSGS